MGAFDPHGRQVRLLLRWVAIAILVTLIAITYYYLFVAAPTAA